ncbi:MAG: propionyl-CoA synthetase [Alphaproteobacteria bacterium]|jgi:propionyl-CoA synthetase|nr:propionyl-CoA synthetase [Alphaproteobacteria bacterium]
MNSRYDEVYGAWVRDPEAFWAEAAEDVVWTKRWDKVLDDSTAPFYRWFAGAETNTCYNAVDRHVEAGRGAQKALVYDSPVTDTKTALTYDELKAEVAGLAGMLVGLGVAMGDRVIIYMPMVLETVVAMLACARIGAVHSVVFGGFAPKELAHRIEDAKPKVILSASCGIEPGRVIAYKPLLDGAIEISNHKPDACVVLQREMETAELVPGRDHDWNELAAGASPADVVPVGANDPLYILYTSGTTGIPKGVVRDNGGHLVALKWSMKNIYDIDPGEAYWAASDVGWVVGHSYIVYAPLFHGCTSIVYEGKPVGTPDPGAFWRVISEHEVAAMFTAPTAFRAIKREDPEGDFVKKYDLAKFRTLFLAGERADPDTVQWAERQLGVPVIDHWWQTETGWPIAANCVGLGQLPVKYGSPTKAVPGYDIRVVDEANKEVAAGETGAIVVKLPLPPGCLPTLWQEDGRYQEAYLQEFPGYYKTADAGYIDDEGYVFVMSRTDDIINVAGHRLSTGGMEEVLSGHPDVAECAVIGVADQLKGQVPLGFVVLKAGVAKAEGEICGDLVQMVRQQIGPVAAFKTCTVVARLPKTRSGKILRGTMSRIADGEDYAMPATIDDPVILDEITVALQDVGYPPSG